MASHQWKPVYDWIVSGVGEKIWTRVLTVGRLHPMNARDTVRVGDKLFIIIPGNPGHCKFYESFAICLHEQSPTTNTVWVISHVGHVQVPPELSAQRGYTTSFKSKYLIQQTRHKMEFILQYVPREGLTNFTLIGHSIGAYIILESLDTLIRNGIEVGKAFMLFPTLERMGQTPNGRFMLKLRSYGMHRMLDTVLPSAFCLLPDIWKMNLIDWRCKRHRNSTGKTTDPDPKVIEAAVGLFQSDVVVQALEMGYDELETVGQLNEMAMNNFNDRIFIVYAMQDDWCPLTYRDELLKRWPNVKNVVCDNHGLEHAFVIFDSRFVAELILKHM